MTAVAPATPLDGDRPPSSGADGTTASLRSALRSVALYGAALWQLVMLVTTLAYLGADGALLATAELVVALFALLSLRTGRAAVLAPVGMMAVGLWAYLSTGDIDSPLVLVACWQVNYATIFFGLILVGARAIPVALACSILVAAGIAHSHPEWGVLFAVVVPTTQAAIVLSLFIGVRALLGVTTRTDQARADAASAESDVAVSHALSRKLSEQARLLHDTAINTLSAVANGGAALTDPSRSREQCQRDLTLLQQLRGELPETRHSSLLEIFDRPPLPIVRSGLDDLSLIAWSQNLSLHQVHGLVGAAGEALANSARHSGATEVSIDIRERDTAIIVRIRDTGVGFDPDATEERGIARSIRGRGRDAGFLSSVRSAVSEGTTVELTATRDAGERQRRSPIEPVEVVVREVRIRAGLMWGFGVSIVGVVLTLLGGSTRYDALVPMLTVMFASASLAVFTRRIPEAIVSAALILATPVVFVLSALATSLGQVGTAHWQAFAATGPFVILLSVTTRRSLHVAGAIAWALVVIGLVAVVYPSSQDAAMSVIVAACAGMGFVALWATFLRLLAEDTARGESARQRVLAARVTARLEAVSQSTYRRWLDAGLDSAMDLLATIRDGADVTDERVRAASGEEEAHLRQLLAVGPDLIHLGEGALGAVQIARERGVDLVVHIARDAPNHAVAERMRATLEEGVRHTPPGMTLTATVFPVQDGLRLTIAQPSPQGDDVAFRLTEETYALEDANAPHDRLSGARRPEAVLS